MLKNEAAAFDFLTVLHSFATVKCFLAAFNSQDQKGPRPPAHFGYGCQKFELHSLSLFFFLSLSLFFFLSLYLTLFLSLSLSLSVSLFANLCSHLRCPYQNLRQDLLPTCARNEAAAQFACDFCKCPSPFHVDGLHANLF